MPELKIQVSDKAWAKVKAAKEFATKEEAEYWVNVLIRNDVDRIVLRNTVNLLRGGQQVKFTELNLEEE